MEEFNGIIITLLNWDNAAWMNSVAWELVSHIALEGLSRTTGRTVVLEDREGRNVFVRPTLSRWQVILIFLINWNHVGATVRGHLIHPQPRRVGSRHPLLLQLVWQRRGGHDGVVEGSWGGSPELSPCCCDVRGVNYSTGDEWINMKLLEVHKYGCGLCFSWHYYPCRRRERWIFRGKTSIRRG